MPRPAPHALSAHHWLEAWSWWDGAWYVDIATRGYFFVPGRQSSVAFFPAYPGYSQDKAERFSGPIRQARSSRESPGVRV